MLFSAIVGAILGFLVGRYLMHFMPYRDAAVYAALLVATPIFGAISAIIVARAIVAFVRGK
jgi:FtsH-binding integral membrane protein